VPGFIAMAVLLVIGLAAGAGDLVHRPPTSLHGADLATQLALGVQAQQGGSRPPAVNCPSTEPVAKGHRFQCTVAGRDGTRQIIDVVEVDSRGSLQWHLAGPTGG
jgi:hypothetical protein